MSLRPYQIKMVERIMNEFIHNNSVMCQMPTGTGKTQVFCEIIQQFLNENGKQKILVLVHRVELLRQIKYRLKKDFNINAGTIDSNGLTNYQNNVIVGMVASVVKRKIDFSNWHLIIDEAHHSNANTYISIIENILQSENSKLLGVTATPARLDGKRLSDIYQSLLISPSLKWYIEKGYLSKIRYYGIRHLDLENIQIDNLTRDYNLNSASAKMSSEIVLAETLTSYLSFGKGKKTLIFCVDVNHANSVKRRFEENDIDCDIINSNTKESDRYTKVEKFKKNKGAVLINVLIFTEGFDCPDIEVLILARPTQSITLYLQMIGRVTRISEGKKCGIILDNAANYKIHGLPTSNYDWQEMFSNPNNLSNQEYVKNNHNRKKVKGKNPPLELNDIELYELIDEESFDCFETNSHKDDYVYVNTQNQAFGNLDFRFLPINQDCYYLKNYKCLNCNYMVYRFRNSENRTFDFDQILPFFQLHLCNNQQENVVHDNLILDALPISIKRDRNHSIYKNTSTYQYIVSRLGEDTPNLKKIIYEEIDEDTLNGLNPIIARRINQSKLCITIFKMNKATFDDITIDVLAEDLDSLFLTNKKNYDVRLIDEEFSEYEKKSTTSTNPGKHIPGGNLNNIELENTVKIGWQRWMIKNLNEKKFRNGDLILEARTNEEWIKAYQSKTPAWCYYNNDCEKSEKFGLLYNWYAINDKRQLAPEGWFIPTTSNWDQLFDILGNTEIASLKIINAEEWKNENFENKIHGSFSGFSALPGGYRLNTGKFLELGNSANWWCDSNLTDKKQSVTYQSMFSENSLNFQKKIKKGFKGNGFSVRCLTFN
jgi:uncharacterized protein (TIGR02145 family)